VSSFAIFLTQQLLSGVAIGLVLFVAWPRLTRVPRAVALIILLLPHLLRHLGLGLLVPEVVGPDMPRQFAEPVAYGDLAAEILAIMAVLALRVDWIRNRSLSPLSRLLCWAFSLVGLVDIGFAFGLGARYDVYQYLGAQWFVTVVWGPVLVITHLAIVVLLTKRLAGRNP
jgi:hypothetical protein